MTNKARGEISAEFDGKKYIFVATLGAIAEIEDTLDDSFTDIAQGMNEGVRVSTLLTMLKAFAKGAGMSDEDVASLANSTVDIAKLAETVGACVSAAFDTGEPTKN